MMKFFVVGYTFMKKFLLSVILIFFCNGLALSGEFDWTKTATDKSGKSDFFLDHQSVRTIGNYNYQWILTNYLKDSQKVKSDVSYATIDCKKNRMQMVLWSEYSDYNAKGKIEGHSLTSDKELEWLIAKPDTVMSALIENSCKNKTSSFNSADNESENIKKKPKNKKSKYKEF